MADHINPFHPTRQVTHVYPQQLYAAMEAYYHALSTDQGVDEAYYHYLTLSGGNQEALDEFVYGKWLSQTGRLEEGKDASPTEKRGTEDTPERAQAQSACRVSCLLEWL